PRKQGPESVAEGAARVANSLIAFYTDTPFKPFRARSRQSTPFRVRARQRMQRKATHAPAAGALRTISEPPPRGTRTPAMHELTRVTISLESALLEAFDRRNDAKGYATRSEAIRDLIRDRLVREESERAEGEQVAVVTLVYDHHARELA